VMSTTRRGTVRSEVVVAFEPVVFVFCASVCFASVMLLPASMRGNHPLWKPGLPKRAIRSSTRGAIDAQDQARDAQVAGRLGPSVGPLLEVAREVGVEGVAEQEGRPIPLDLGEPASSLKEDRVVEFALVPAPQEAHAHRVEVAAP
jgi:hypothetical protein